MTSPATIKKILEEHRHDSNNHFVFISMVNCLLVALGGREGALLEAANRRSDKLIPLNSENYPDLFEFISLLGLKTFVETPPFRRILVLRSDNIPSDIDRLSSWGSMRIGEQLGFYCPSKGFSDGSRDRVAVHINIDEEDEKLQIYAEIGVAEFIDRDEFVAVTAKKVFIWNSLLQDYGISFSYSFFERISRKTLLTYLRHRDWKKVEEYKKDIINLLGNTIRPGIIAEKLEKDPVKTLQEFYELYLAYFEYIDQSSDLRPRRVNYSSLQEYRELQDTIFAFYRLSPWMVDPGFLWRIYNQ